MKKCSTCFSILVIWSSENEKVLQLSLGGLIERIGGEEN